MEDEIAAKVPNLKNTQVICRSGDPTDLGDLALVTPQTSRSIIVLSPEGDDPDWQVIKTVLALVNDPKRRTEQYQIAAEIRDGKNAEVARVVGGDEVQLGAGGRTDLPHRRPFVAPVGPQRRLFRAARFRRLRNLHDRAADLTGKSFGDALMAYDTAR